jgi:hypothetical protein
MIDLTKIEKPFGLLDKETQDALRENDGTLEVFDGSRWVSADCPSFFPTCAYRAAPLKLPEWPAGLRSEWWWITKDEDGQVYAYKEKPSRSFCLWDSAGPSRRIDDLIPISFDGIPWKQAIIQRPEGV